ncbi:MAG: iron-containing alcohol dehydrogenase [Treponematales bacterium]
MADIVFKLEPEVISGRDTINRAGALCGGQGGRALLVTEQALCGNGAVERLTAILEDAGIETIVFDEVPGQGAADTAETAAALAKGARCTAVIGFGGLAVQSAARMAAVLANSRQGLFALLDGAREDAAPVPCAAIPTEGGDPFLLAGGFLALDPRDRSMKLITPPPGLRAGVILDSGLMAPRDGKSAAAAFFDGLFGAVEAYCSAKATVLSDALLEQAIALYGKLLASCGKEKAGKEAKAEAGANAEGEGAAETGNSPAGESAGDDFAALSAHAAFLAALGSAASAPGIGTALAFALNGKFSVPKPWCSTVLLPWVLERLAAARPEKTAKAAALLGMAEAAAKLADALRGKIAAQEAPAKLSEFRLSLDRLVPVAESARALEFAASSPWTVTAEDAYALLKQAF